MFTSPMARIRALLLVTLVTAACGRDPSGPGDGGSSQVDAPTDLGQRTDTPRDAPSSPSCSSSCHTDCFSPQPSVRAR